MEVYIETLTGSTFGLTVSSLETVLSLKAKIQRLEGIPVSQQHLIWQSMELEDDYSLQDYKINEGATIKLVISMRGGPINTRRVAIEDPTWKEIADYMEANREELWEKLPGGRQVTLLVFRDGDQINFFRVIDRGDGTVAPVAEAVSQSSIRSLCNDEIENVEQQRRRENNVTMQKMRSIRKEMEALTLKKPKRSHHIFTPSYHSKIRAGHVFAGAKCFSRLPPVSGHRMSFASQTSSRAISPSQGNIDRPRGASVISTVSRRLSQTSSHDGQCPSPDETSSEGTPVMHMAAAGVPSHECLRASDIRAVPRLRRDSVPRLHTMNGGNEIVETRWPHSLRPSAVSASRDTLNSSERRNSGLSNGTLAVLSSPAPDLTTTKRHVRNLQTQLKTRSTFDNFEQLQQTLAKFDPRISVQSSPRSRITNKKTILDGMGFLSKSPRCDDRISRVSDVETNRPLTSPEISDIRKFVNSTDKLQNEEKGDSTDSTPSKIQTRSVLEVQKQSAVKDGYNTEKDTNILLSDKLKGSKDPQPQCSGNNSSVDAIQIVASKTPSDSSLVDRHESQNEVLKLPPLRKSKKNTLRCQVCSHKLGLATTYTCRCGQQLCATHRYAEMHTCTYDYKTEGRKIIEQSNPLITASKLPKI